MYVQLILFLIAIAVIIICECMLVEIVNRGLMGAIIISNLKKGFSFNLARYKLYLTSIKEIKVMVH